MLKSNIQLALQLHVSYLHVIYFIELVVSNMLSFLILGLIYSILQIINILINNCSHLQNFRTEVFCRIFEKFYPTFLTANLLLIGFLELTTLSKTKNKIDNETGKSDNYIWQEMFLLSWVASIFRINRYEQLELKYVSFIEFFFDKFSCAIY